MSIDTLNNSQLILLVLLIVLVVSAATSVATLSLVYERITPQTSEVAQPTIIQQTVNRIIEREPVPVVVPQEEEKQQEQVEPTARVTVQGIKNSFTKIYHGSQQVTVGIFVSGDGALLVPGTLEKEKRYNIARATELIPFSVEQTTSSYSLLRPLKEYTPIAYVPFPATVPVEIGQSAIIIGGFDDKTKVFSEIVSQKETNTLNGDRIRTSVAVNDPTLPSAVFVNDALVGFLSEYTGWIPLITFSVDTEQTQEETSSLAESPEEPSRTEINEQEGSEV